MTNSLQLHIIYFEIFEIDRKYTFDTKSRVLNCLRNESCLGFFGKLARLRLVTISSFSLLNLCIFRNDSLTEILSELPITNEKLRKKLGTNLTGAFLIE